MVIPALLVSVVPVMCVRVLCDGVFATKPGSHVLVHGGEGTDCTLLITSLAQLILDKDSRTVSG